jgi:hypothetical protein
MKRSVWGLIIIGLILVGYSIFSVSANMTGNVIGSEILVQSIGGVIPFIIGSCILAVAASMRRD